MLQCVREVHPNTEVLVDLPVTKVPRDAHNKAKARGLWHLQYPDACASSVSLGGIRIVHEGEDELLV
jgi:hypothetical protein